MAAPYTDTAALANLVQTAYDRQVRLALRSTPQFRAIADTKPVQQTQPGSSVVFNIHQDLSPATTPLNETTDPAGVSANNTTPITVTLNEYGNFTVATKRLREFALDSNLDSNLANLIAYNQADSVDKIVEAVLAGGANIISEDGGSLSFADPVAATPIKARDIRQAVAELRSASVAPVDGQNYVAYIHPRVANDLRTETDAAAWRTPANYVDPSGIIAGEIGVFEGVRFIESPRCSVDGDDVYNTYILGREALAEAVAEEFHVVADGVVVDPLKRKMAIGWYGIAGWNLFRPESLWVVRTASNT